MAKSNVVASAWLQANELHDLFCFVFVLLRISPLPGINVVGQGRDKKNSATCIE